MSGGGQRRKDGNRTRDGHRYEVKGAEVKRRRLLRGFSRKLLSDASGVPTRTIARIESGQAKATIRVMAALSAALDVSISEFVDVRSGVRLSPEELRSMLNQARRSDDAMNYGDALRIVEGIVEMAFHDPDVKRDALLWQAIFLDHAGQQERALALLDHYLKDDRQGATNH